MLILKLNLQSSLFVISFYASIVNCSLLSKIPILDGFKKTDFLFKIGLWISKLSPRNICLTVLGSVMFLRKLNNAQLIMKSLLCYYAIKSKTQMLWVYFLKSISDIVLLQQSPWRIFGTFFSCFLTRLVKIREYFFYF